MNYIIRKAERKDCTQIGNIHYQFTQEKYADTFPDEFMELQTLKRSIRLAEEEYRNILVAADGDTILGYIQYGDPHSPYPEHTCSIEQIHVLPVYRRNRIATALLLEAMNHIPAESMNLTVYRIHTEAIAFFKYHGFRYSGGFAIERIPGGETMRLEMILHRNAPAE